LMNLIEISIPLPQKRWRIDIDIGYMVTLG